MPTPFVDIDIDMGAALRYFEDLDDDVVDAADEAAEELARMVTRRSRRILIRRGHVVTGKGLTYLGYSKQSNASYVVKAPRHLTYLHTGTQPHYPPYANNRSLQTAAAAYGMSPRQLAEVIGQRGTRAHPWIGDAVGGIARRSRKEIAQHINDAIEGKS